MTKKKVTKKKAKKKRSIKVFRLTPGQPPKYETPKQLQDMIQSYLDNMPTRRQIVGSRVVQIPAPTISGVAYHLGFASRQSFYDYEKMPQFSYTIKRIRLFIENEYEKMIQAGNAAGAIFALKNFGWTDKSEIEISNESLSIDMEEEPISFVESTRADE